MEEHLHMKKNLPDNKNISKSENAITKVIDTMLDRIKENEDVTEAIVDVTSILGLGGQFIPAISAFMTGMKTVSAYTDRTCLLHYGSNACRFVGRRQKDRTVVLRHRHCGM